MAQLHKMKRIPSIKSVMTPFPHSIDIDAGLDAALRMMLDHDIHHLPVTEDGRPVGVLRDREVELALHERSRPAGGKEPLVRDICTQTAHIVASSEPLDRVLERMGQEHVDCTVVVKDGRLVGIFTVTDACKAFGELLRALFPEGDGGHAA
jgi:acetoin utilization protein AcuB